MNKSGGVKVTPATKELLEKIVKESIEKGVKKVIMTKFIEAAVKEKAEREVKK
jgi:hypothetical protein